MPAPPRPLSPQVQLVIDALRPGVVSLIRDLNGNHVVQRCLQRLGPEDSQFIYDAAAAHCLDIATHRHGCCVLQRCIDYATNTQKRALIERIADHSLMLSQVGGAMCVWVGVGVGGWVLEGGGGQGNGHALPCLMDSVGCVRRSPALLPLGTCCACTGPRARTC
jgi:hypothetical protein